MAKAKRKSQSRPKRVIVVSPEEVDALAELLEIHAEIAGQLKFKHTPGEVHGTPYRVWLPGHASVHTAAERVIKRLQKGLPARGEPRRVKCSVR